MPDSDDSENNSGDEDDLNNVGSSEDLDADDSEIDPDDMSDDFDLSEEEAEAVEADRRPIKVVLPGESTIVPSG